MTQLTHKGMTVHRVTAISSGMAWEKAVAKAVSVILSKAEVKVLSFAEVRLEEVLTRLKTDGQLTEFSIIELVEDEFRVQASMPEHLYWRDQRLAIHQTLNDEVKELGFFVDIQLDPVRVHGES